MERLSDKLDLLKKEVEQETRKFIEEHQFFLEFRNKSWSSSHSGQTLLVLSRISINLGYEIESLRRRGL
jgi:hypothetical protein